MIRLMQVLFAAKGKNRATGLHAAIG